MTIKEAKDVLQEQIDKYGQEYDAEGIEALEIAIKILEKEPCSDCISRKAVIDIVNNPLNIRLDEIIKKLPPVTSQPKKGHWIDEGFYAESHNEHAYRCSKCDEQYIGDVGKFDYCPKCGIKMKVEMR